MNYTHPAEGLKRFHETTSSSLHERHFEETEKHYYLRRQLMEANEDYTRTQVEQANIMTLAIVASILGIASAPFGDSAWGKGFDGFSKATQSVGQFLGKLKEAETAQVDGARQVLRIEMEKQNSDRRYILDAISQVDRAVSASKDYMRKADAGFFN